jgi:hypothetical protein
MVMGTKYLPLNISILFRNPIALLQYGSHWLSGFLEREKAGKHWEDL